MTDLKPAWERVKFGDVVRQVKERVNPKTTGLTRYVAGEHMDTDELRIRRWGEIGDGYLGPAFHMHFKPGQVLYGSRRTYLRKVAVPDFEGICANTTFVLESADPSVLLPDLLPFIMRTECFHEHSKRESKGSVNPYVNFSDLAWYEFALPPLAEQQRVVEALRAAQRVVESSDELRHATRTASSALVEGRLAEFRGKYPEVLAASVLTRLTVGIVVKPTNWYSEDASAVPALRSLNVSSGKLCMDDVVRITPEGHAVHKKSQLLPGDVVVVRTGRPGEAAVIPEGMGSMNCIDLIVTTPDERLVPEYFALLLNSAFGKQAFASGATGTAQQHFNVGAFRTLRIPLPPREIQAGLVADANALQRAKEAAALRAESAAGLMYAILRNGMK